MILILMMRYSNNCHEISVARRAPAWLGNEVAGGPHASSLPTTCLHANVPEQVGPKACSEGKYAGVGGGLLRGRP